MPAFPGEYQPTPGPLSRECLTTEPSCPHCGALDIPTFEGELAICPACGAVLPEAPEAPPKSWLGQWPPPRRAAIANWFYAAYRSGHTTPPAIVDEVIATLRRRLQWTAHHDDRQCYCQILNAIADDRQDVERYAVTVIAREELPAVERAALKRERAKEFMLTAMRGKPPSSKQLALLRSKGYAGPLPANMAEASTLIDRLLRTGGRL